MSTPYPTAYQIEEMFANRGVPDLFHTYLADPIDVTVVGQDFHVGGHYNSMQAFHDSIYGRVAAGLKVETIRVEVMRVIGGGESAWAAVESLCTATSKYGERTSLLSFEDVPSNAYAAILLQTNPTTWNSWIWYGSTRRERLLR